MYGLAATCRMVMPPATTKRASKNKDLSALRRQDKQQAPQAGRRKPHQNATLIAYARNQIAPWNGQQAVSCKPCKLDETCLQKGQFEHLLQARNEGVHEHRQKPHMKNNEVTATNARRRSACLRRSHGKVFSASDVRNLEIPGHRCQTLRL